jgi:hypothetical protein
MFSSNYTLNKHINAMHPLDVDDLDEEEGIDVDDSVLDESDAVGYDENGEGVEGDIVVDSVLCEGNDTGDVGDDEVDNDGDNESDEDDEYINIWRIYSDDAHDLKSLPEQRNYVVKRYIEDINYYNKFRRDPIHKQIMATKCIVLDNANEDENCGNDEALKIAISKRQHLIYEAIGL